MSPQPESPRNVGAGAPSAPTTGGSSLLMLLRERTRAEHDAIEQSLGLLTSATLTLGAYRRTLERLYGFYRPVEEQLRRTVGLDGLGVALSSREKTALLDADLQVLGSPAVEALPRCDEVRYVDSVPAALGCMYVLEGSSLGGQIISRRLSASLGITAETGGRFFQGYGAHTGAQWKAFTAILNAFPLEPTTEHPILQSATCTFQTLRRWCTQSENP